MSKFNQSNAALRICVDAAQDGHLSGRVFSQMLTAPMSFSDPAQLLLQIEVLLDAQNYPQAFQRARAFQQKKTEFRLAAETPGAGFSAQDVADAAGLLSTLTVHIVSRRSSTWQGRINWEDGEAPEPFSSALEFMRLLDSRMLGK